MIDKFHFQKLTDCPRVNMSCLLHDAEFVLCTLKKSLVIRSICNRKSKIEGRNCCNIEMF